MTPIDVRPDHLRIVREVLHRHLPVGVKVWVFGSRASWTTKDSSDLDLALDGETEIPRRSLSALEEAFEDSDLPYTVDVVDLKRIGERFRRIVTKQRALLPESFRKDVERDYLVPSAGASGDGAGSTARPPAIDVTAAEGCSAATEWPIATLGDCIEINNSTYASKDSWPFINYLDTGNVTENRIAGVQHLVVGKDEIPSRARRKVLPGDIVYSTVRPNQKHFGLLKRVPDNFLASTGFSVIRGKTGLACTDFIYWFLAQDRVVEQLQTIAEHSTSAYPSIKPVDIERLTLNLPPLSEQRAIAHVLGALDDKIELNRRMNATLEAMARALFKSWFVDFDPVRAKMEGRDPGLPKGIADLFPDRLVDSEMGPIPEGWKVSEIGSEVDVRGGATPSTKEPVYWNEGQHHWATPRDLSKLSSLVLLETDRKITDAGVQKISSGLLPTGTVLLSSRAPIGYLAVVGVPTAVNQGFIAMVCERRLPNLYVLFWCHESLEHIKGIAGGSTFSEISKKAFRPLPVVVPSQGVLGLYEKMSRPLYGRVVASTSDAALLASLRDKLLPKLISGKMRARDAEKVAGVVA